MKKAGLFFVVAAILVTILPITTFARGGCGFGGRSGRRVSASYAPRYDACTVEDCDVYGPHEHDGAWYCNQGGINWNSYDICTVEGCTVLGLHEHDGTWYHCANYPNGGGCGRNWW